MSLTGGEVELRANRPIICYEVGFAVQYQSHPAASPSPHVPSSATFNNTVRQGVILSAIGTAVVWREGNPIKTLLSGQYVMYYFVPSGSDHVRDPGISQVAPNL
jgi:hypothetical protein